MSETDENAQKQQPGLLTLNLPDRGALHAAYMPFIRNGGLFVATTADLALGDEVLLLLTYEQERYSINGKVVWINPRGAQGRRRQGVGVQFSPESAEVQKHFEALLGGMLTSDRPTETM